MEEAKEEVPYVSPKTDRTSFGPFGDCSSAQHQQEPARSENGITKTQALYMQEVKEIFGELDETREADKKIVAEFRTKMNEMVEDMCGEIEQKLVARYERSCAALDSKLECLNEIIERVGVLEQELTDFNGAVTLLFQGGEK